MFSGLDAEGCYVGCLSLGIYFNTGDVIPNYTTLLESGDCLSGSAYEFELDTDGWINARIGGYSLGASVSSLVLFVIICKQYTAECYLLKVDILLPVYLSYHDYHAS